MKETHKEFPCEGNFADSWAQFLNFVQISDQE